MEKVITDLNNLGVLDDRKHNILIAGGVGSGKTTMMELLIKSFQTRGKVSVVGTQDKNSELDLGINFVEDKGEESYSIVKFDVLEEGLSESETLRIAQKVNPKTIVFDEIRTKEVLEIQELMDSGYQVIGIVHSSFPEMSLERFDKLKEYYGSDNDESEITFDYIIHCDYHYGNKFKLFKVEDDKSLTLI